MNKKPTSLALSIIALQVMAWLSIITFLGIFGFQIYALYINPDEAMWGLMLLGEFAMSVVGLFLGTLFFFTAKGLINQKKWARITAMFLGILLLFGFPIGTIVGILLIYGTTKGWPEQLSETTNKNEETNNLP